MKFRSMRAVFIVSVLALALGATVASSSEGTARAGKVGETAPDFTLRDLEGGSHRLSELRGRIVVLEWTSHVCPAVAGWYRGGQVQQTRSRLGSRVAWLAVDSSFYAELAAEGIAPWWKQHGGGTPYLLDPSGAAGRGFGAKVTPQFMVVSGDGVLAYRGALSDWSEGQAEGSARQHVEEAVAALEKGQAVPQVETRAAGCGVKYAEARLLEDRAALAAELLEWSASYAREGMEEAALDLLRGAMKGGHPRPSEALSDARFRPLRDRAAPRKALRQALEQHARESSVTLVDAQEKGEPLHVSGVVRDAAGQPVPEALLYVFQTDVTGLYSEGGMDESNPRLFGFIRTDQEGRYAYRTIRPGHYPDISEPVEQHVHVDVSAAGYKPLRWRLGFRDDRLWKGRAQGPPRWAVEVERGEDGVSRCRQDLVLQAE